MSAPPRLGMRTQQRLKCADGTAIERHAVLEQFRDGQVRIAEADSSLERGFQRIEHVRDLRRFRY